jgi:predicted component of type VI protein secretion system
VFNQHAIPRLLKVNGMDASRRPTLSFGDIHQINIAELADFIQKASGSGALVVDEGLDEYLRQVSGLPPKVESEEGVNNNPNVAPPQQPAPSQQAPQPAPEGGQPAPAPKAPSAQSEAPQAPPAPEK